MPEPADNTLLEMRGISKAFPGVQALDHVDFTVRRGEIHALMGENGAGKSTLIKVVTGVYRRDAGTVRLERRQIDPHSPMDAEALGISTVYQEVNLIPHLSVAENICLGRERTRFPWLWLVLSVVLAVAIDCLLRIAMGGGFWREVVHGFASVIIAALVMAPLRRPLGLLNSREMRQRARKLLARVGLHVDISREVSSYSIAIQQMVAIARALGMDAKLLILDEPTSSLDENEVEQLFAVMRKLRDEGLGIIFITHFLDQVYVVSDRITVLKDGRLVGEYETARLPKLHLVGRMVGKEPAEVEAMAHKPAPVTAGEREAFVRVEGLGRAGAVAPVDMTIARGEVVGLAGLLGSGRTELARLLFGVDRASTGRIAVGGRYVRLRSPRDAVRLAFAFTPEDRKMAGIIPNLSVRENIVLALQASRGAWRTLPRKRQVEIAERFIRALDIKTPGVEQAADNLSGGNQQKVLLARWLATEPRLLILDEPTRGIDVGAKAEIEKLIARLRADGLAILFISSELDEVVRSSQRVVVLRDRAKVGELVAGQISEQAIMRTIARHEDGDEGES
ncbi:MAG: sugar ABC transporter ATP-binding protein [Phycisphaerae bacterium]